MRELHAGAGRSRHSGRDARATTGHCPSNLGPVPKPVAGGTVQGLFGDLEMQEDLSAMVALVGERVTKKSHRAQLNALDVPGAFCLGEQLPHGFTGVDKRLPQRRPGSRSARDFVEPLRQSWRAALKPVEPCHVNVHKITYHCPTPREDRRRQLLVGQSVEQQQVDTVIEVPSFGESALNGGLVCHRPPEISWNSGAAGRATKKLG